VVSEIHYATNVMMIKLATDEKSVAGCGFANPTNFAMVTTVSKF
jgi:hypothetical protein